MLVKAIVRIAALDVSDRRIGIAVVDELGLFPHPVGVVHRRDDEHDFAAIERMVGEPLPGRFVVGLPLNMNDTEGPQAQKARAFGERLATRFGILVDFWDERLTTFAADSALRDAAVPGRRRKALLDQMAAQIILEDYLRHHS